MIQTTPQCIPSELLESTAFLLGRLGIKLKKRVIEELESAGFSPYDFGVLALVTDRACETQATIADGLGLDRSQLVGLLDGLEERELIERRRDPNDRRRHTVTATSEGKKQLAQIRRIVKRVEDEFLAPLDASSREQLHALLVTVAQYHDPRFSPAEQALAAASV
jgi:MarR family transcriptional regulator, lower aerobic nicotinate degradation pathway regulator